MAIIGLVYCVFLYRQQNDSAEEEVNFSNPFELGSAIKFGLLFTLILVVVKIAQIYLGNTGIYLASALSGLADVDAITLSMARLRYYQFVGELFLRLSGLDYNLKGLH